MDSTDILTALRNELVTAGLVRKPGNAGPLTPLHVAEDVAPAPGDREPPETDANLVVTADLDVELGRPNFAASTRIIVIRFLYRSRKTAGLIRARRLDSAILDRIADRPDGGLGWIMDQGGAHPVFVHSSALYGGLGRVAMSEDGVIDHSARYVFEVQTA